ncbi:hypothetical protein HYT52_00555 [Candidatus Woesearchaeota archaeon]|nr:hypothetical protein [Candidatus Woesearchaeota archaeon]
MRGEIIEAAPTIVVAHEGTQRWRKRDGSPAISRLLNETTAQHIISSADMVARLFFQAFPDFTKEADIVIVDRSDLVRTTMTAQHLLAGAGYDPDGKEGKSTIIWKPEDNRIGLANGMDFQHPELPGYKPTLPEADDYVKGMLQHFWTPQEGAEISRPVASRVAYALVDNRIRAIEELLPEVRKGATAFHLQVTHAPLIDSLDAALFGTVRVDVDGRANFNEAIFPGHYAMGMFIGGETLGAVTDNNPRLEMVGRPFLQGHREVSYTLDGLKLLRYNLQAISEERK